MPLILHGFALSTCHQRVLIVAAELGLDIQCVDVNLGIGEQKQPSYLEHQPFGQVPWLEDTDTGVEMFESRAICRYLVAKSGSDKLMPLPGIGDYPSKLAKFETAASIEYSSWDPLAASLAGEGLFKKAFGGIDPDAATMAKLSEQLSGKLDGYERLLSKQTYLAGSEPSLADLFHLPTGKYLFRIGLGDMIMSRPNVARWWKSIVDRDSLVQVWKQLKVDQILDSLSGK